MPSKIVCIGRNYPAHASELGNPLPGEPLIFLKPPSAMVASGEAIVLPHESGRVEYEGEIGVVIGRRTREAGEREAVTAISGLVALNDVTARDLQKKDGQWARAKGFDTFCPVGVMSSEVPQLDRIEVVTRLNGEERQRGLSSEMAFSIPYLVSYVSRIMTLEPGDIIATGTPAGVGPLKAGDVVEVEVVGHSMVRNPVTAR